MKWTLLRHRMLAFVAKGDTVEHRVVNVKRSVWKYRRTDGLQLGADSRALGELGTAGALFVVLQNRFYAPRPVRLSKTGERLLSEWDTKHGSVTE